MSDTATPEKIQRRKNPPLRRHELDSRSLPIGQKEKVALPPLDQAVEHEPLIVVPETALLKDDYEKLAFNEEPLTILIHRSGEKFAPRCTDYVAVNGRPAEMLCKNGWIAIGYLPRGQSIIVKRKVVERLALSKMDHISTTVITHDNEDPQNYVERTTVSMASFTVLDDKNPKGTEWLAQLYRMQG